jgi:3-dehydroquinate synthase
VRELTVALPGRDSSYQVRLAWGLRYRLAAELAPLSLPRRLFVVTDQTVARLHADHVLAGLKAGGYDPQLLTVPPGEKSKSWRQVTALTRELLARGADRTTALMALGGGVVGDLTGLVASLFMRGLPLIQVPTTLLAMVDASIGGKTAINLPEAKNLLGTFHQPRLVAIDPEFLQTLPPRERLNGLAEVLKAGFIREAELLKLVENLGPRLFQDRESLSEVIFRAAAIKAGIVAADEREGDVRRLLNFGHTLGHALEAASRYRLPHGQAVAHGMIAALCLSRRLTGLSAGSWEAGVRLIRNLGLARRPPGVPPEAVLAALGHDKKRQAGELVFVLLRDLGAAEIVRGVPLELVAEVLPR